MPSGPGCELQLPHPVGEAALERGLLVRLLVADKKGAGDADRHRIEAAALGLDRRAVGGDGLGDIGRLGVLPQEQIVALLGDAADGGLAAGAHPDRRVRALRRRRLDHDIVERPVLAAMRERRIGSPGFDHHLEAFVEARAGLVHVDAETAKLVVAIAAADAEIEPAAREKVEGRRLLGEQHRVVPGQHDDRGAEPQGRGARAEPGQQVERRRNLTVAGEMVLDDKGAVKSEPLGLDIVVDEVTEPLGAVEFRRVGARRTPRRRAAEQTEPHAALLA